MHLSLRSNIQCQSICDLTRNLCYSMDFWRFSNLGADILIPNDASLIIPCRKQWNLCDRILEQSGPNHPASQLSEQYPKIGWIVCWMWRQEKHIQDWYIKSHISELHVVLGLQPQLGPEVPFLIKVSIKWVIPDFI